MNDTAQLREAHLYMEEDMKVVEDLQLATGSAAVYSARSPVKETVNEDAAVIVSPATGSCVLAVADGAGGMRAGAQASAIAVRAIHSLIDRVTEEETELREPLLNAIEQANHAILDLGIGANTTLAAVEIRDNLVRPYHVGDSMILVVGQRGRIKLQTVSHSPVGYGVEAGLLDQSEAMHHDERHIVSNMLGTPEMRIEIGSWLKLARRDTLLIATDGLFDNLHLDEIVETIRKGPLGGVLHSLTGFCLRRMGAPENGHPSKPDDVTFLIYRPLTH